MQTHKYCNLSVTLFSLDVLVWYQQVQTNTKHQLIHDT